MRNQVRAVVLASLSLGLFSGCSGGPAPNIGPEGGKLLPCPSSPNCVSTTATDELHAIDPLPFRGTPEETMASIVSVVETMVRTRIITGTANYLHVEYRTRMGFVDDLEFLLDEQSRTVHFRSASRLGHGDLGVNRKRMEEFSRLYLALP